MATEAAHEGKSGEINDIISSDVATALCKESSRHNFLRIFPENHSEEPQRKVLISILISILCPCCFAHVECVRKIIYLKGVLNSVLVMVVYINWPIRSKLLYLSETVMGFSVVFF